MKTLTVAAGLAAIAFMAMGFILISQVSSSTMEITYESTEGLFAEPQVGIEKSDPPSLASLPANTLSSAEIKGAVALLEQDGALSDLELAMLSMALYQKHENPEAFQAQSKTLMLALQKSQLQAQLKEEGLLAFKSQEQKILSEILAMPSMPDNMTPQQYLKQRLSLLRKSVLVEGNVPAADY